jgi:urease accessory protein
LTTELTADPALTVQAPTVARWRAELALSFDLQGGRTRLAGRTHSGPLMVQRPFYPERDGTCHVYLLHPPGGVAGGDELDLSFRLDSGARAVLTTPGAAKFYRSPQALCTQTSRVVVGEGAVCEYLPQETILFDGARAAITTSVSLARDATYVGWDFFSLGRPAAAESFGCGDVRQTVRIDRDGQMIWYENLCLLGGSQTLSAAFGLAGRPIVGTMIYAGPLAEDAGEHLRRAVPCEPGGAFSVSQLEDVVVCRYLGTSMAQGKATFVRAWQALRQSCQGKPASLPRIWST